MRDKGYGGSLFNFNNKQRNAIRGLGYSDFLGVSMGSESFAGRWLLFDFDSKSRNAWLGKAFSDF